LEPLKKEDSSRPNGFTILNRLYLITPGEAESINSQILRESTPTFRIHALDSMIEVILMERSKTEFDRIVSFILRILGDSLKTGDYHGAAQILKRLYPCLRMTSLQEWQKKRIKKAIFDAGTESRIRAIETGIKSSEGDDLDGLARYVALLQRNAVPHLCKLLGELKGSKPRRIICDALADIGRRSIGVFGAFLDDQAWYVVRNMVYILGRIGEPECLPYLEKVLDHPDPRVRREAVQALPKTSTKEVALSHLRNRLNDRDQRIRGVTALQLARIGGEDVLGDLLGIVRSKLFQKRESREIRQFFKAIGMTGSDDAVPALFRLLVKKSLLGKSKSDEIRESAAEALGTLGTPEAIEALKKISQMGDKTSREASLTILRRMGQ
jgi:hypothetical protein